MSSETVFVKILDKEYQVACPAGEKEALLQAAHNLDERMREIRSSGSVIGLERIAVMAALNLSHELLETSGHTGGPAINNDILERLSSKVDQALSKL
ncbi:cell division protein ZapA [Aestuariicella sp. G3-2]|uniref:cell division protein ZapA n=1 Tax=Pseudomaricurvus albidus TaxID=2842452 RepID=UPI001C0CACF7|nr:cell division protein ZapA [Aestuariicella albida]MBU3068437.1 cell division protein ZapA [Aestuariicella albida]